MPPIPWQFIVLALATLLGPLLFRNFRIARQTVVVRAGGEFTMRYSTAAQVTRSALKFAVVWVLALAAHAAGNTTWLTAIVLAPLTIGLLAHFPLCRRARVHWYTGRPLAARAHESLSASRW